MKDEELTLTDSSFILPPSSLESKSPSRTGGAGTDALSERSKALCNTRGVLKLPEWPPGTSSLSDHASYRLYERRYGSRKPSYYILSLRPMSTLAGTILVQIFARPARRSTRLNSSHTRTSYAGI